MSRSEKKNDRIKRICRYEAMLDEAAELLESGHMSEKLIKLVGELEAYYTSPLWKQDLAADEAGLLPGDLKRGVLSEDGIYDLLTEYQAFRSERNAANTDAGRLETEQLILRPWEEEDAEEWMDLPDKTQSIL